MSTTSTSPRVLELLRFTETHRRHTEALARATGEHFNIFNVLSVGHLEVKTHSPILAELLNPMGSHGQGAAFLRLFLSHFKINDFSAESKRVTTMREYYIGAVTNDSGGRIDIVVKDGEGSTIFIENKIYANDQDNQMERYWKFDKKAHLFYLTLDGRDPCNLSEVQRKGFKCECVSYGQHILAWLKDCLKESACVPGVRETISQYIHLIQELTNQSTTTIMNSELIKEVTRDKDSLAAFFALSTEYDAVLAGLVSRLDPELNKIANANQLTRQGKMEDLSRKNAGFYFTTPGLLECNLTLGCVFDSANYGNFCFGFCSMDPKKPCPVADGLFAAFSKEFPREKPNVYWPAWAYWEEPYRWWKVDAFEGLRSGQFVGSLKNRIERLAAIARQVCPDGKVPRKE